MRRALWLAAPFAALTLGLAVDSAAPAAQTQDHQYTAEDIEAGSRLYTGQCTTCHGANGDTVAGVNLRRGQFRRAMSACLEGRGYSVR